MLHLLILVFIFCGSRSQSTALLDYVKAPDESFSWKVVKEVQNLGSSSFILQLVSQTWLDESQVDRNKWIHWLTINVPDRILTPHSFLMVDGGSNSQTIPSINTNLVNLSVITSSITAEIKQIPNQPLSFCGGPARSEDALIAFTWRHFFQNEEPKWLMRFPMVKSVVKAMDTIQQFVQEKRQHQVKFFTLCGASKRGWTVWLTPAVDTRIVAVVPIVIDVLNFQANLNHHYQVYGGWSFALKDYIDLNITNYLNTPKVSRLMEIIDPISYNKFLVLPKYIISASGDEFFVPESSSFYFDQLYGSKYQRVVPNTGHSLQGKEIDVLLSVSTFYRSIIYGFSIPIVEFKVKATSDQDTWIHFQSTSVDSIFDQISFSLWKADTPNRDFRNYPAKPLWTSIPLATNRTSLSTQVLPPSSGYTGYFVEVLYGTSKQRNVPPLKFTSQVVILPSKLPFPACPDTRCACGDACTPPQKFC